MNIVIEMIIIISYQLILIYYLNYNKYFIDIFSKFSFSAMTIIRHLTSNIFIGFIHYKIFYYKSPLHLLEYPHGFF